MLGGIAAVIAVILDGRDNETFTFFENHASSRRACRSTTPPVPRRPRVR
jgi:hypothetical protein